jgi:DNA-binding FadR family transcriptional regulator
VNTTPRKQDPGRPLHAQVLDGLGRQIASGHLLPGTVHRIDGLDEQYGVSRSVVREAVRVLDSMGMVETRKRLGVRVLPSTSWHVLDPRVIRWRLDGPGREQVLLSLGELHRAVEPVAAELAATRATPGHRGELLEAVVQMAVHSRSGNVEAYLESDRHFHLTLLAASGNEMLAALAHSAGEHAGDHQRRNPVPVLPNQPVLRLHGDVAGAVQSGDGAMAAETASRLVCQHHAPSRELPGDEDAGVTSAPLRPEWLFDGESSSPSPL